MYIKILIPCDTFDNYFDLLYKVKFNNSDFWIGGNCIKTKKLNSQNLINNLESERQIIKNKIENLLSSWIENNEIYQIKLLYRFVANELDNEYSLHIDTGWLEFTNVVKFFHCVLFNYMIIEYWFINNSYGLNNSKYLDFTSSRKYGIEYLDLVGCELCDIADVFFTNEYNDLLTPHDYKIIYNYKKSEFNLNFINNKISHLKPLYWLKDNKKKFNNVKIYSPTKYLNSSNKMCWNLIEIFDIFLFSNPNFYVYVRTL